MLNLLTLNWNGFSKLTKLYNSILPCLENIEFKWLIKDNGSTDNSVDLIKSWNNPNIDVIDYKHNKDNFSEGMNIVFQELNPQDNDFILLLNNDVIFNDTTSLQHMMDCFSKYNHVGVVGARLLYTGTNRLQHAGVIFTQKYQLPAHYRANERSDELAAKDRQFQAVTGAVSLTKAEYYRQICDTNKSKRLGLDERYIWCYEDIAACLAIKTKLNKKIVYCGSTNIFHEESASLKINPINKLFLKHNINIFRNSWSGKYYPDEKIYEAQPGFGILNAT